MAKAVNLLGQKFGRLTVLSRAENDKHGAAQWLCVCICGNKKVVRNDKLRHGETLSCGCYRKEKGRQSLTTHGLSKKPHGKRLEKILANMKYRCNNPHWPQYKYYGGRGIKVCKEWETSFVSFYEWAISNGYEKGLTIDRIDNNKGYSPDNCRWANNIEQQRNKRNNRLISFNGETLCLAEWSERTGLTEACIYSRLKKGWNVKRALTELSRRRCE